MPVRPLVLTACLDPLSKTYFDDLRKQHFPLERNYLAAHLTLFHALPGEMLQEIQSQIETSVHGHPEVKGEATGLRSLGNGVAFVIHCPELTALRGSLAQQWSCLLTAQDKQRFQPHITVQNKVDSKTACVLLERLQREFSPKPVSISGLDLWHYDGGPWSFIRSHLFAD